MRKALSGLFLLAFCLTGTALLAAPPTTGGSGVAPVDGGAVALLVAAAGYGYWKLKGDKNTKEEKEV